MARQKIALFGATGNLGRLIASHLLRNPDVDLTVAVRAESRAKLDWLEGSTAEIVDVDLATAQPDALRAILADAQCVISAVQGGPEIIIDAQARLLEAAREAGVRRFIPSTFSYDIFAVKTGQNVMTDQRIRFAEIADATRGSVEVSHIMIGIFMDLNILRFVGALDFDKAESRFWGDGPARMDLTTYDDTAAFTAAAAADPAALPRGVYVAGSSLDFAEFVATYERVTGRPVNVRQMGSLADLSRQIEERFSADPSNIFSYLPLMYWRATLDGSAAFKTIMNFRFPSVDATTFESFIRAQSGLATQHELERVSESTLVRAAGAH